MRRIMVILVPLLAAVAILFWVTQKQPAESIAYHADHVWTVQAADSIIHSIAFSPDDAYLAIGCGGSDKGGQLTILNTRSLEIERLGEPKESIRSVAFSPDGETLASAGSDRVIELWDVRTRECKSMLRGHSRRIYYLAFSPDGRTLASSGQDGLRMWNLETGDKKWEVTGGYYGSLWFTPDGTQLISSGMRYWDAQSGTQIHDMNKRGVSALSKTGDMMARGKASSKRSTRIEIADARTGQVHHALNLGWWSTLWTASFSHDDRLLAVGGWQEMPYLMALLQVIHVETGDLIWTYPPREEIPVESVVFANKSNDLAVGNSTGEVTLWRFEPIE